MYLGRDLLKHPQSGYLNDDGSRTLFYPAAPTHLQERLGNNDGIVSLSLYVRTSGRGDIIYLEARFFFFSISEIKIPSSSPTKSPFADHPTEQVSAGNNRANKKRYACLMDSFPYRQSSCTSET